MDDYIDYYNNLAINIDLNQERFVKNNHRIKRNNMINFKFKPTDYDSLIDGTNFTNSNITNFYSNN